jgi:cytochrome c oxidase subunit 2
MSKWSVVSSVHRLGPRLALAAVVVLAASAGWMWGERVGPALHRSIDVTARSFAFEPAVLRVNKGDRVTLHLRSADVVHGFHLEGHDIDATVYPLRRDFDLRSGGEQTLASSVTFVASRAGKNRYRCSVTCGSMHPFMVGELIVEPNRLWSSLAAAAVAMTCGSLFILGRKGADRDARA